MFLTYDQMGTKPEELIDREMREEYRAWLERRKERAEGNREGGGKVRPVFEFLAYAWREGEDGCIVKRTIQFSIRRGDSKYVADCVEFPIVTEAPSLDALVKNIEESVALFLKDEDLSELGLAENPVVLATLELEAAA